jgi:hypothetical protein
MSPEMNFKLPNRHPVRDASIESLGEQMLAAKTAGNEVRIKELRQEIQSRVNRMTNPITGEVTFPVELDALKSIEKIPLASDEAIDTNQSIETEAIHGE